MKDIDMNNIISVTDYDNFYKIETRKIAKNPQKFTMVSCVTNDPSSNFLCKLVELPKAAQKLLQELLLSFDYTTNTALLPKLEKKSQSQNRSKNIQLLRLCQLLEKDGRDVVLMNPYYIIPPVEFRDEITQRWLELTYGQNNPDSSNTNPDSRK